MELKLPHEGDAMNLKSYLVLRKQAVEEMIASGYQAKHDGGVANIFHVANKILRDIEEKHKELNRLQTDPKNQEVSLRSGEDSLSSRQPEDVNQGSEEGLSLF